MKDLYFLGRVYDYEVENEHLMTAFQQFLDQSSNDTKSFNFTSIILKVWPEVNFFGEHLQMMSIEIWGLWSSGHAGIKINNVLLHLGR